MCVKQMVTDLAEERLPKRRSLPLEVGLERETRVELATPAALRAVLCLGSRCSATELLPLDHAYGDDSAFRKAKAEGPTFGLLT